MICRIASSTPSQLKILSTSTIRSSPSRSVLSATCTMPHSPTLPGKSGLFSRFDRPMLIPPQVKRRQHTTNHILRRLLLRPELPTRRTRRILPTSTSSPTHPLFHQHSRLSLRGSCIARLNTRHSIYATIDAQPFFARLRCPLAISIHDARKSGEELEYS